MQAEEKYFYIATKDRKIVRVPQKLTQFTKNVLQLQNLDEDESNPIKLAITSKGLEDVLQFCEAHKWEIQNMKYILPLFSNDVGSHIDKTSYDHFEKYISIPNDRYKEKVLQINELLEAGFLLQFEEYRKIVNIIFIAPLYCRPSEDDYAMWLRKWKVNPDDLNTQVQKQIVEEYPLLFDKILKEAEKTKH